MTRYILGALAALLLLSPVPAQETAMRDTMPDTWTATDALGRSLPGVDECGPPRPGKFVAIFYFLWLGNHGTELHDISKILAQNPDDPPWGPRGAFHFWHEPHLGYYFDNDEWVIRKHAQMLTDAGVDAVFFDVTNVVTYDETYLTLCQVYEQIRGEGGRTPQVAFLTHTRSAEVVQGLYDRFYSRNLYPDLWFRWLGKPVILAPPDGLSEELRNYFTLRASWAWTRGQGWFGDGRDKWPWLDNYPQTPGWHVSPDQPEQIAVAVAQHPTSNIGRSFHDGHEPPPAEQRPELGLCFDEQWRRALEVDPELVYVTGWNEWVAQRFVRENGQGVGQFIGRPLPEGGTFFVDTYSQEYSRDIEPMRGGHGDNYYYQMASWIRRFKGVRPTPKPSTPRSIRLDGGFEQWRDVGPEYLDDLGDTMHRDHRGWGDLHYTNTSGRNDIVAAKVARDAGQLFFYVRTREPFTPAEGNAWMMLLLDVDADHATGWEGYDFVLNRRLKDPSTGILERNVGGGWSWEAVAEVALAHEGNELHLAIPRAVLGLLRPLHLDFKWADNVPESGDILDFFDQGDVAPNGRFSYRFAD